MKKKWFTLIELIVVVWILMILGVIVVLSLTRWIGKSKDSVKLSDLNTMRQALELYYTYNSQYPLPDDPKVEIYYSWELIAYQWKFWEGVFKALKNLTKLPKDPETWKYYTYAVNKDQNRYKIAIFINSEVSLLSNYIIASQKFAKAIWDGMWVVFLLDYTPLEESVIWTKDFYSDTNKYILVYHEWKQQILSWDSIGVYLKTLSVAWEAKSCKEIINKDRKVYWKNGPYAIFPTLDLNFRVYCDMTTEWWWWTLIATLDKNGLAPSTWLWTDLVTWWLDRIINVQDASINNQILQIIKPTEFRFLPADDNNNLDLNSYFYFKPDYKIDYTKLFIWWVERSKDPVLLRFYYTPDGGNKKYLGRIHVSKHYLMQYRDSTNCNWKPCGLWDFDAYIKCWSPPSVRCSSNYFNISREWEWWRSYRWLFKWSPGNFVRGATEDVWWRPRDGILPWPYIPEEFKDKYSKGYWGVGIMVR